MIALTLLLARVLVASMFVVSSIGKLKGSPQELNAIQDLHVPAPAVMERLAGICEVVAAAALILGIGARLASVLLALFMVFITLAFLRFWSFKGAPEGKQAQEMTFFGNITAIGALLYIVALGPGSISLLPPT